MRSRAEVWSAEIASKAAAKGGWCYQLTELELAHFDSMQVLAPFAKSRRSPRPLGADLAEAPGPAGLHLAAATSEPGDRCFPELAVPPLLLSVDALP